MYVMVHLFNSMEIQISQIFQVVYRSSCGNELHLMVLAFTGLTGLSLVLSVEEAASSHFLPSSFMPLMISVEFLEICL